MEESTWGVERRQRFLPYHEYEIFFLDFGRFNPVFSLFSNTLLVFFPVPCHRRAHISQGYGTGESSLARAASYRARHPTLLKCLSLLGHMRMKYTKYKQPRFPRAIYRTSYRKTLFLSIAQAWYLKLGRGTRLAVIHRSSGKLSAWGGAGATLAGLFGGGWACAGFFQGSPALGFFFFQGMTGADGPPARHHTVSPTTRCATHPSPASH